MYNSWLVFPIYDIAHLDIYHLNQPGHGQRRNSARCLGELHPQIRS
jgi:hypothetical protein